MSANFVGVTFAEQSVTPSDDAIVRRAMLADGVLSGCGLSYSGSTLTMAAGTLMICGRQIRHPSVQNWPIMDATSGFARLVLTIDMTRASSKGAFDQVVDTVEYASSVNGFANLEQTDINGAGTKYQIVACIVSLGTGGITGIVSQLSKAAVQAESDTAKNALSIAKAALPKTGGTMTGAVKLKGIRLTFGVDYGDTPPANPVVGQLFFLDEDAADALGL